MTEHPEPEPETPPDDGEPEPEPDTTPEREPETTPEGEDSPEGDQPPETPQGMSDADLEKVYAQLDKETARHAKRVAEIMGDEAVALDLCPLCEPSIPGFVFAGATGEPRSQLHGALLAVLANPQAAEYREAKHRQRCDDCDGWGVVVSGSRVGAQETVPCARCNNLGHVATAPGDGPVYLPPAQTAETNGGTHEPAAAALHEPPEVAALRAQGYFVVAPTG